LYEKVVTVRVNVTKSIVGVEKEELSVLTIVDASLVSMIKSFWTNRKFKRNSLHKKERRIR
jgi:hypothetical protein